MLSLRKLECEFDFRKFDDLLAAVGGDKGDCGLSDEDLVAAVEEGGQGVKRVVEEDVMG